MPENHGHFSPLDEEVPSLLDLQAQALRDDNARLAAVTNEALTVFVRGVTPLGTPPEQQRPDGTIDWEAELQVALDDQRVLTLRPSNLVDAEDLRQANERLLRAKQTLDMEREE